MFMQQKRQVFWITIIACILVMLCSVPSAFAQNGTITGHVYESDGTTPIPNVHVDVHDLNTGDWVAGSQTDGTGYYSIGVPTGSYVVRACATCAELQYVDEVYDDVYNSDAATPVSVTAPGETPNIDFNLEQGGTISGDATVEGSSTPIGNLHIYAVMYDTGDWINGTNTQPDGSYSLRVPTGTYKVCTCAGCSGLDYVDECYDNVYGQHNADPVSVTEPGDTPDIDFSLALGGTITGHVYESDGTTPIQGVHMSAQDPNTGDWVAGSQTDENGFYSIAVPTGSYVVQACATCAGLDYVNEYYNNAYTSNQATAVPVTAPGETPNIDFNLEQGGTISGDATVDGSSTPVGNLHIYAVMYDTGDWINGTNTQPDGSYSLRVPTGTYKVCTCANCTGLQYVDECYDNVYGQHNADPVSVTEPNDTPNIDFSLALGGTITGYVYESDGTTPIQGVHMSAQDPNTGDWAAGSQTDENGFYSIVVPTGSYVVQACTTCAGLNYVDEYYNDVHNFDDATPVPVTAPQETPNINFTLETGATVSGTVYQSDGVTPVTGVEIKVRVQEGDPCGNRWTVARATTDPANGTYTITGVPAGTSYYLQADNDEQSNYINEWWTGSAPDPSNYDCHLAQDFPVFSGDTVTGKNFHLTLGGSIFGYVYQEDGITPIPNLHVRAETYDDDAEDQWSEGTDTNPDGSYTIAGVPDGTYEVNASSFCSPTVIYAGEYYDGNDGTYDYHEAASVPVTPPNDTSGINFILDGVNLAPRATREAAIQDGVAWLAGKQNPDGSWGTEQLIAQTALAVLVLEEYAKDQDPPLSPFDPGYAYHEHVENGLNFLFANAYTIGISLQPAGNPDRDGDGIGVYFDTPGDDNYSIYRTSMVMMAIAASNDSANSAPARIVAVSGSPVDGWSYEQVLQDTVEYMAWAQTDFGYGRGGWNYGPMDNAGDRSDQSNSGWVTLGLMYAEAPSPEGFGLPIPGFVRTELDRLDFDTWINYTQDDVDGDDDDGGSHYSDLDDPDGSSANILRTGNLLQQMALVGDIETTPRVQDAINYLVRHWNFPYGEPGWRGCPACYQATYTTMKGLEALDIDAIDSINWFQDFTDVLMSEQANDGGWPLSQWDRWERILSTEWALLTLLKAKPPTEEGPDLVIIDSSMQWVTSTPLKSPSTAEKFCEVVLKIIPIYPSVAEAQASDQYRVFYTVKNRGNVEAPAWHTVSLVVDGALIEEKDIPVPIAPGETYSDGFNTIVTLSGETDEITLGVDTEGEVEELNEENNSITVPFPAYKLTVEKDGTGKGNVRDDRIDCGLDCSEEYGVGASVTLTAIPDFGSMFAGWSGACSGKNDCVVTMDSDKSVTATFDEGDVFISKVQVEDGDDGLVAPGDTIFYEITVENFFENIELMISDALTGYVDFLADTLTGDISGTPLLGDDLDDLLGSGEIYTLSYGDILTITFDAVVRYDAPIGSIIENTATVHYLDFEKSDTVRVEVIPEPATLIFIGIGLVGIFALVWRRRRRKK